MEHKQKKKQDQGEKQYQDEHVMVLPTGVRTIEEGDWNESKWALRRRSQNLELSPEQAKVLVDEFALMVNLRQESVNDYLGDAWIRSLMQEGYTPDEIHEMFQFGRGLPKFGHSYLALGTLITEYKKYKDEVDKVRFRPVDMFRVLKWLEDFFKATIYEMTNGVAAGYKEYMELLHSHNQLTVNATITEAENKCELRGKAYDVLEGYGHHEDSKYEDIAYVVEQTLRRAGMKDLADEVSKVKKDDLVIYEQNKTKGEVWQ